MKKAVVVFICLLAVAGFVFLGMPHLKAASASQDVPQDVQKAVSGHSNMQEVAGYGSSDEGQDSSGYGSDEGDSGSDEGDSGGYGSDEGDSGSDSGGYGN